jgi:hypothetical protein
LPHPGFIEELLQAPVNDPIEHVLGFALVLGELEGDLTFTRDHVLRDIILGNPHRGTGCDLQGNFMRKLTEPIGPGYEIGLTVHFDHDTNPATTVAVEIEHAVAGFAIGTLGCGGQALLAQKFNRLFHVAAGFFERLSAIEDAGSRLIA